MYMFIMLRNFISTYVPSVTVFAANVQDLQVQAAIRQCLGHQQVGFLHEAFSNLLTDETNERW